VVVAPELQKIIDYESTNLQWAKVVLNWGLIVFLIIIKMFQGGKKEKSVIGVLRCEGLDWGLFVILQVICVIALIAGVKIVRDEQAAKELYSYKFTSGDLKMTNSNIIKLIVISFFGGMAAAFCGIGPGFLFAPVLIMVEIEPRVATSTGMYVTMFTTLAATIQAVINNGINLEYSVYVQLMTFFGTFPGIFFQNYVVK
jgi:hypothetical protein